MPIYEYVCMKCEEHFEELVRGDQVVACPECGATNVARQLSQIVPILHDSSGRTLLISIVDWDLTYGLLDQPSDEL